MKLIAAHARIDWAKEVKASEIRPISNDSDPRDASLEGIRRIELSFPKFTDGRAFSQAFLLSRRLGFKGDIVATGDVLIDQLAQMQRSGFTVAVLREDQNLAVAERVLAAYPGYLPGAYQGDAVQSLPLFARPAVTVVHSASAWRHLEA